MPIYSFLCPARHESCEIFSFENYPPLGSIIKCQTCGQSAKRVLTAPAMYGAMKLGGNFKNQEVALGQKFTSIKEIDDYCRKEGLDCVGNTMPREFREYHNVEREKAKSRKRGSNI